MKFVSTILTGLAGCFISTASAAAVECAGIDRFECLSEYVTGELDRLELTPNKDQAASFNALSSFDVLAGKGPHEAVKQWEADGLPVYDLILALLLANRGNDAEKAALAAEKPFSFDADSKALKGEQGLQQMREDLKSFYHGEEDMAYARACVSDQAFKDLIGGGPQMRIGACRIPYDTVSVQRAFAMMQLLKAVTRNAAVDAVMQYAYRVPSCAVASAIINIAPASTALADDKSTAAWKVLDMATICAAEMLTAQDL